MGEMGSAVARRLHERGATVITRLPAAAPRARRAPRRQAPSRCRPTTSSSRKPDFILSIVPPGDAVALAERLAPAIKRAGRKPVYVDCNAVSPQTAERIGEALQGTGCTYVDAGIIGPPPGPNSAHDLLCVGPGREGRSSGSPTHGLTIRVMDGPNGAASAMKLSYAGITKGCTAIGSAMMLGATRGGTADALLQELSESQPMLLELDARFRLAHAAEGLSLGRRDGGDRQVPGGRSGGARHVSRHRALL